MNSVGGLIAESDSSKPKSRLTWRTLLLLPLPRFLSGFRLGDWWRLLREHRFSVDPIFWPRAVWATLGAAVTSILARLEEKVTPEPVDAELLERPVFILGLPRSGTTHLFELLSQSPDLCFPTRFDAFNPHSFLLLRRIGLFALLSKLPKFKRAMDNLRVGWDSPEEDIVALAILASKGERLFQMFPRDSAKTKNLPVDVSGKRAKSLGLIRSLRPFLEKLIHLHGKRVLLKSPGHMGRVEEILEVFPQAKFVTIFRNPLHQTASLRAMRESGNPFWCALQWPVRNKSTASLQNQGLLLRGYFEARIAISPSNLFETTFEELVSDRAGTISRICEKFSIRPPANFETLEATARNARSHGRAPDSWIPVLREHYKPLFDAGLYPPP
jgi:omega-hydroxy-beta-dihydromenaquinone-9 sulfotransferase